MRIRKLIAQKKISEPNSNVLTPSPPVTPTKTIIPSPPAAADVSTSSEEEERVNNSQEKEVVVCELNMSLWDVIPVKELRYYLPKKVSKATKKGKYDVGGIRDESVNAEGDRISIVGDDIEPEDDDEEKPELVEKEYATAYKRKLWLKSLTKKNKEKRKRDCNDDIDDNEKEKKKKVVYCCQTVGEGWHCRSKAQLGSRLCKHHLIQKQRNSDHQRDNNQKIQKLEKKIAKRGRPPKESSTNTTNTIRGKRIKGKLSGENSSEFYYYSGFGPLWGKNKRGRPLKEVKKQPQDSEEEDAEEEDAKEEERVKLEETQEVDEAAVIEHRTSPKMNIVKEENVDGNDDNDNGCMFIDDEFDDDDEDSDEDCNGVDVKKRYRKPIKARSLASLFSNI